MHSSSGRQPNFAALNRGRHLYSAGRPSRWALARISSFNLFLASMSTNMVNKNYQYTGHGKLDAEKRRTTRGPSRQAGILAVGAVVHACLHSTADRRDVTARAMAEEP